MISQNIYKLRKARGITQSYLAEILGVSFQTISKWETGIAVPDVKYVISMAKFFDVTTDQLLGLKPLECDYFSRKTESAEYWNDELDYINSSRVEMWNSDYMEFLIQKVWKIDQAVNVLDFGCGNGYLAGLMMPFLPKGSTYTGVDISDVMINDARHIYAGSDYPVQFICKNGYDYHTAHEYDMVICQTYLRELSNPMLALNKMISTLRPGGIIVCIEVDRELDNAGIYVEGLDYGSILDTEEQRKYWVKEYEKKDRDYAIGIRLPFYMRELGITNIEVRMQDKVKFANPDIPDEYKLIQESFISEKGWKKDDPEGDKQALEVLTNRGLTLEEAERHINDLDMIKEKIRDEKRPFLKSMGLIITYGRKA